MGDNGGRTVTAFPPPPGYYKLYTEDRWAAHATPPPPPPQEGRYVVFGKDSTLREEDALAFHLALPDLLLGVGGVEGAAGGGMGVGVGGMMMDHDHDEPTTMNHKEAMKKVNHSIVYNFMELLTALVANPREYGYIDKVEDLKQLFVNMHLLINSFRPHQARETVASILEEQLAKRSLLLARTKDTFRRASSLLAQAQLSLSSSSSTTTTTTTTALDPQAITTGSNGEGAAKAPVSGVWRVEDHMDQELLEGVEEVDQRGGDVKGKPRMQISDERLYDAMDEILAQIDDTF